MKACQCGITSQRVFLDRKQGTHNLDRTDHNAALREGGIGATAYAEAVGVYVGIGLE